MQVILTKDVDKIGTAGSVVKVAEGFARNFLFPQHMAVKLTDANLKQLEHDKQNKALGRAKAVREAEALKSKLEGLSLTIPVLTQEDEKLYGSVTEQDIARALTEEGIAIDKTAIKLESPIKSLGIYEIPVALHPEVSAKVKMWIVKK